MGSGRQGGAYGMVRSEPRIREWSSGDRIKTSRVDHISRRDLHKVCESAIKVCADSAVAGATEVICVANAGWADPAADKHIDRNELANGEPLHTWSDLMDLSDDLVSERDRKFHSQARQGATDEHVAVAQPDRCSTKNYLAWLRHGDRYLDERAASWFNNSICAHEPPHKCSRSYILDTRCKGSHGRDVGPRPMRGSET
jgi:hypothetical protein